MNVLNLFRIALIALQRNKLRAFLTMLGIIIGVAAVIAMVAIGQGSKQSIHDQLSNMGSNMITILPASNLTGGARIDASSLQTLTIDDVNALERKSQFHTRFAALCAEVCETCAADCEALGGMEECVEACRHCARLCRELSRPEHAEILGMASQLPPN